MKVLVACEVSGIVRDAFTAAGHDAWSCDLEPSDSPGFRHIISDAVDLAYGEHWDLMIAHPPCTYLTNAANRWLYEDSKTMTVEERLVEREKAIDFFILLRDAPIDKIAIENPWPYREVAEQIGPPTDFVQPWMFGEPESKGIFLWLKNLPPLMSTVIESNREQKKWRMSESKERAKERSKFFPGIARAMADQWSD
jgi:hypothetical protein